MKRMLFTLVAAAVFSTASAQMVVSDPAGLAQSIINTSKTLGEASATRSAVLDNVLQTQKIYDETKKYYDYLKKVNSIVKDSHDVKRTIELATEISDFYTDSFSRIASDPLYTAEEIAAISFGYSRILERCAFTLSDLKTIIGESSLSMTDKERLDIIMRCHDRMEHYRRLLDYYTRKLEAVSMIRYEKGHNLDGFIRMYGKLAEIEQ